MLAPEIRRAHNTNSDRFGCFDHPVMFICWHKGVIWKQPYQDVTYIIPHLILREEKWEIKQ